eukprot:scaffold9043_cov135-Isochrysis_galbana.AAC.1
MLLLTQSQTLVRSQLAGAGNVVEPRLGLGFLETPPGCCSCSARSHAPFPFSPRVSGLNKETSPAPGRAPTVCDPTEILEFVRLAVFWAMRVGRRVLWRFLCCGHGKLELACNQGAVRRNRFTESLAVRLEAHPTVYGWLIGSRVGVSSVGLKRAGSADPVLEEMAAGALRGLVCAFFVCCWCLAPKNTLRHLRTTQDVRRRSVKG